MAKKKNKDTVTTGAPTQKEDELLSPDSGKEFDVEALSPREKEALVTINKLPPETQKAICNITATRFSGPLPPPEVLQGYEETLKGAADRILTMTEGEAKHRREVEKKVVNYDAYEHFLGLVFGLIVALTGIGGGVWCITQDQAVAGSILSGGTIVSLVGVFVYGSRLTHNNTPLTPAQLEDLSRGEKEKS